MSRIVIFSVVGARPQFVKMAMVDHALRERGNVDHRIIHTGQHYDDNMSDVFFRELSIPEPWVNLHVAAPRHGAMTGQMLERIEALLVENRPDGLIVYGDTNSTLAGALAASKLEIPLAHVEAGLRSFNKMPEEINRILTDRIADLLYSVTDCSTANLLHEGISRDRIHQVGDVMYDCALRCVEIAERHATAMSQLGLGSREFALCTVHRAVNTDDRANLANLIEGLSRLSRDLPVVLPLHPRTRARMSQWGIAPSHSALRLVEPIGYIDMVQLERAAAVVVTDSGGVQREAYFHGTPCVTFRDETEWVELVELDWNVLVRIDDPAAFAARVLERVGHRGAEAQPYGDGNAAVLIAASLVRALSS